ncbi:ECF transporter S component [Thermococcus sp.]
MADVTAELAKYTPYVFLIAIAVFVLYIWKNREKLKSVNAIAIAGVTAALVAVATNVVKIPTPPTGGYINFGDTMVMFTAMLFGPVIGAFAGGVGSALGDVIGGYPGWAPVTLVVKGIEGLVVGYIAKKVDGTVGLIVGGIIGGLLMVLGYFLFEAYAFGVPAALTEVPGNLLQAVTGVLVGAPLTDAIRKRYPEVETLI